MFLKFPQQKLLFSTAMFVASALPLYGQSMVNFDDGLAPALLSDSQPLTTQLAAYGITWSGTGAIVQGWSWEGTGYSSPNLLGYVSGAQFSDNTFVQTSDVMSFATPQVSVSFLAFGESGLYSPRTLIVEAFDSNDTRIRSFVIPITTFAQRIVVTGPDIARIAYAASYTQGRFAIDDIVLVPEPSAPALLAIFAVAAAAFRIFTGHTQSKNRAPRSIVFSPDTAGPHEPR